MKLFTIGFAGKSAETFFGLLGHAGVNSLLDIRLNNRSQLAGFTKAADLEFFLRRICGISYHHFPQLAPSQELLEAYRKKEIDWDGYLVRFAALMRERKADAFLRRELKRVAGPVCLLCSESDAARCHRGLIAARVAELFPKTEIIHL